MSLKSEFKNVFSSGAFKLIDGSERIIGKFGEIEKVGDKYDIYIHSIGERKLSNILNKMPKELCFKRVNGEAWCSIGNKQIICDAGLVIGIRKRKVISEEQKKKIVENLNKYRKGDLN